MSKIDKSEKTYLVVGDLMRILVDRGQTNGRYITIEATTSPGAGMPILHTHAAQETFHILEGDYEFYLRDADGNKYAIPATAGDVVHVPSNEPHGFTVVGDKAGKALMMIDGEGGMDDFFSEIGIPIEDENNLPVLNGPPDMEALIAICTRYGISFVEAPSV